MKDEKLEAFLPEEKGDSMDSLLSLEKNARCLFLFWFLNRLKTCFHVPLMRLEPKFILPK